MTMKSRELVIYDGASSAEEKLTQCNSDLPDEKHETKLNKLKTRNFIAKTDAEDTAVKFPGLLVHCTRRPQIVYM